MPFLDYVQESLRELEVQGLRRKARDIDGPQGPRTHIDGRSVLCMCSNNYLGLANHPELAQAMRRALETEGAGAGASRLISGSMRAHRDAESALAAYVHQPASALFSTGYACNVGVIQALARRGDVVFSDALNHASLIDGMRLSRAKVVVYQHADAEDLAERLRTHRPGARAAFVVTESLFSMDGDLAPLRDLAELAARHDAALIVDEAHALGVMGPGGRGGAASLQVTPDLTIGTLGKAFGTQGAFVAGAAPAIDLIRNRARSYVYSTAPSPSLARAAEAAVHLVQEADDLRSALFRHAARLRAGLANLGYSVLAGESPIIPLIVGDPAPTMALSHALLEQGVFAHGIRPPTVPAGTGRLRIVPMASHTDDDIDDALAAFKAVQR